jgi:hypothetical protein
MAPLVTDTPAPRPPAYDEPQRDWPQGPPFEDYLDYGRGRYRQPHRGAAVLVLGILSLVICGPLGIAAWVMGSSDLAAMRRGEMDPSGEGTTRAGQICGIIATVFMIVAACVYGMIIVAAGAGGAFR